MIYLANDKFFCVLTQGYNVGETVLYVNAVPDNVPTILVANKGTVDESVLTVTGKTSGTLIGVAYLKGRNINLLNGTVLYCLNNEEFINQYLTYLGISWRGEWNVATTYAINEGVSYNGSSYIAIAAGINHAPPNASYWVVVSAKGETGSQGVQGNTGLSGTVDNASGLALQEIATPTNPSAGYLKVYAKSDNKLYYLDSDGVEKAVGSGGVSGGVSVLEVQVFS